MAFYRQKQKRRGGAEEKFIEAIKISPAEGETCWYRECVVFGLTHLRLTEIAICKPQINFVNSGRLICSVWTTVWNTHARIVKSTAKAHIEEWSSLTPAVTIRSPYINPPPTGAPLTGTIDLDSPDELSIRSLLLGIVHRTAGEYIPERAFLVDAHAWSFASKFHACCMCALACRQTTVLMEKGTERGAIVRSIPSRLV